MCSTTAAHPSKTTEKFARSRIGRTLSRGKVAARRGLRSNLLWVATPLLGLLCNECEGLCIIPQEATHLDRWQQVNLRGRVNRVIGQGYAGQGTESDVDEFDIRCAESKCIQNLNILLKIGGAI